MPANSAVVSVAPDSRNAKIGRCVATYAPHQTCPADCRFLPALDPDGGWAERQTARTCYASCGVLAINQQHINRAAAAGGHTPNTLALAEAAALDALRLSPQRRGRPVRLHVSGDCATTEAAAIVSAAAERATARGFGAAWTYTHAWRTVPRTAWGTVSVLASVETDTAAVAAGNAYTDAGASVLVARDEDGWFFAAQGDSLLSLPFDTLTMADIHAAIAEAEALASADADADRAAGVYPAFAARDEYIRDIVPPGDESRVAAYLRAYAHAGDWWDE